MVNHAMVRRLTVALAVGAVLAATTWLGSASASASAPEVARPGQGAARSGGSGAQTYAGCLSSQGSGDLMLLIDQSGSLGDTDPNADRVTAAKYLLRRLAAYAAQRKLTIDIDIAGFADKFYPVSLSNPAAKRYGGADWIALNQDTLGFLDATLDGFVDRHGGQETDYWSALQGAGQAMADRAPASAGDARPCQAIAWFTDGQLDIVARNTPDKVLSLGPTKPFADDGRLQITSAAAADQAETDATQGLCRSGGVADALRQSGITLFAVGLQVPGQNTPADFGLMRSIAIGDPPGSCGNQPASGTFETATNLDTLLAAFDSFPDPPVPPGPPSPICQVSPAQCPESQLHQFVLDSSIQTVHILGTVTVDGVGAALVEPAGSVVPLPGAPGDAPRTASQPGLKIDWQWLTGRTIEVDLVQQNSGAGWPGVWSLAFTRPAGGGTSSSNIKIWSDLLPALVDKSATLTSGSVADVRLGLVKADDPQESVAPQSLSGTLAVSAFVVGVDGVPRRVASGLTKDQLAAPVALDLTGVAPGKVTLRLTMDLTTASPPGSGVPGTALVSQSVDVPVQIQAAPDTPTIATTVDFGTADGTTTLTRAIDVTGPGCVWIAPGPQPQTVTTVTAADGQIVTVDAPDATSAASCLSAGPGEHKQLMLRFRSDRPARGHVAGTVTVTYAPLGHTDQPATSMVAFSADMKKPFSGANFLAALLAALLLGPGIPLGLLYLAKWWTARIPDQPLSARQIPVVVDGGTVLRDGSPFEVRPDDFVQLVAVAKGGSRELDIGSARLRTHVGASPVGPGFTTVEVPGRIAASSSKTNPSYGRTLLGRLPLAVHNTWVVVHDPTGPDNQAEVLMLVSGDASAVRQRELGMDVAARLADVLATLRQAAQEKNLVRSPQLVGAGQRQGGGPDPYGAGVGPFAPPPPRNAGDGPDPFGPGSAPGPYGGPPGGGTDPFGGPGSAAHDPSGSGATVPTSIPGRGGGRAPAGGGDPYAQRPGGPGGPPPPARDPYGRPLPPGPDPFGNPPPGAGPDPFGPGSDQGDR